MEKQRSTLRGPEADATREAFLAQAERANRHFGVEYAKSASVTDWHYMRGQWTMTFVWLIPDPATGGEGPGQQNAGFHVHWAPGNCVTEAWATGRRVRVAEPAFPLPATLERFLRLAFGVS